MPASSSGASSRAIWTWALYDFANSAFTTLVVTFIYATYFTRGLAPDEVVGTALWSRGVTVTAIAVALLSPYLGALADRGGRRKPFLFAFTALTVAGSVALYFPEPGQLTFALVIFVIANISFEMANVFYNAYLPDLASPDRIGRISGYGWGLGYVGGLLCLVVALFTLVWPETPVFGIATEQGANIRATNVLVALWYAVFSIPLFLFVRERERPSLPEADVLVRSATQRLLDTFRNIRRYRQIARLLVARLVYNDGLVTIFAFGGIYAAGTFGFSFTDVTIFGIALNVSAGIGAALFGMLDDRIGGKRTILITLVGLFAASLLAVLATTSAMLWAAGIAIGLLVGPNQASSRALLGRFVPEHMENEFFGFFAFSGKATAFLGPLLLGVLTETFASQRAGVAVVLAFFLVGGLILLTVDEEEGRRIGGRAVETPPASGAPRR